MRVYARSVINWKEKWKKRAEETTEMKGNEGEIKEKR
jgi:hypothetical protein